MKPGRFSPLECLCAAAIAAGILLRFYRLDEALWLDEAQAAAISSASMGWRRIIPMMDMFVQMVPPLFYYAAHGWMLIFGESDVSLHVMAALLGSMGVLATWAAGRRAFGRTEGFIAGAIMALHPFHIAYSQEFRAYGLLVLLSVVSFHCLLRALEEDRLGRWAALAATVLATLYTHTYALFLLPALALWAWLRTGKARLKIIRRNAALCCAVVALGYAPWLGHLMFQIDLGRSGATYFLAHPDLAQARDTLLALGGLRISIGEIDRSPGAILRILFWTYLACVLFLGLRGGAERRRAAAKLLVIPPATLCVPFIISLWMPIYMPTRYAIIALPFACLFWSAVIGGMRSTAARAAALILFFALSLPATAAYFRNHKSRDKEIAEFIRSKETPSYRTCVFPGFFGVPIARYYPFRAFARDPEGVPDEELPPGFIIVQYGRNIKKRRLGKRLRALYGTMEERPFGDNVIVKVYEKKEPS